ncbi:unnamed protein product [Bemisia tabaci]|uniref:Asteroid n=1 Tax=Bemisia tabaci TaxID=7038 RepID=A0A9P0F383_BEMTA|nr:unnamed protein product [Bemisia tabaci]
MGIPKLFGLVDKEPALFYKPIKLHDTLIVIDGNCISCWLYRTSCSNTVFNGEYSEFEKCAQKFFCILKECNIFPIVILDGAHEARKLKTIKGRLCDKILRNQKIKTIDFRGDVFIPIHLIEVFKTTMIDMEIFYCQSFLEADVDATKAAQSLNCPLLSCDSDFYLDDVDYIPFTTLDLQLLRLDQENGSLQSQYCVQGKLFDRTTFFNNYGGLARLEFLPLFSFLLGNDYSETELCEAFFSRLSGQKSSLKLEQKIRTLCRWLHNFQSPEIAMNDFLKEIPQKLRQRMKNEILRCLEEKNSKLSSYLVQYILQSLNSVNCSSLPSSITLSNNIESIEEKSKWLTTAVAYLLPKSAKANKTKSHTSSKTNIPEWILVQFVQGKLPRNLMEILHTHCFFFVPQIELSSLSPVVASSFQALECILGIIFCGTPAESNHQVTCYLRQGNHLGTKLLRPTYLNLPILSMTEIPALPILDRKKILCDVLKIQQMQDGDVPVGWEMFFFSLSHWYQGESSRIMNMALGCLIFSSIFIGLLDKKLGYYKDEKSLLKKYSNELDEAMKESEPLEAMVSDINKLSFFAQNFSAAISAVTFKDSLLALKHFISFRHRFHSKNRQSKQLHKPILHYFAQFQNNILVHETLNALLNFPFPPLKIANFYCGTLMYNIYFEIQCHKNLRDFVEVKFHHMPTIKALFLSAFSLIEKLSGCPILSEMKTSWKTVSHRRRKK